MHKKKTRKKRIREKQELLWKDFNVVFIHTVERMSKYEIFWFLFSCIRTEYKDLPSKSPHSVRKQENTDQKNSVFGLFLRSVLCGH